MTTLRQALKEINHPTDRGSKEGALNIFDETVADDDLPAVAMMLSLFVTALCRYPDLTV